MPHLVAATLMNAASRTAESHDALLRLAAGGFRDMTRVAAGQPSIWPDICADNAAAIVAALDQVLGDLAAIRDQVAAADRTGILTMLQAASGARRALPAGVTRPDRLAELRVPVPDRQGMLAEITTLAGDLGINIYDIEIAHSTEGPRGVLVLVVDADRAGELRGAIAGHGHACTVGELPDGARRVAPRADPRSPAAARSKAGSATPGDKSISHRALILGALAEGWSELAGLSDGDDVARTEAAVRALGADVEVDGDGLRRVRGRAGPPARRRGHRLRQLGHQPAPVGRRGGRDLPGETTLSGDDSLSARPMDRIAEPLRAMGARRRGPGRPLPAARSSIVGGALRGIEWIAARSPARR